MGCPRPHSRSPDVTYGLRPFFAGSDESVRPEPFVRRQGGGVDDREGSSGEDETVRSRGAEEFMWVWSSSGVGGWTVAPKVAGSSLEAMMTPEDPGRISKSAVEIWRSDPLVGLRDETKGRGGVRNNEDI